jgi:hypothetical protein
MNSRWMLGCLVFCAAACGARPTPPGNPAGDPTALCRQAPPIGTALQGATLVHAATFEMLLIESCGFDASKVIAAAKACHNSNACGSEIGPPGQTVINQALSGTLSPVSLGGGPAFMGQVGTRTVVVWDGARDAQQVVTAIGQGTPSPGACCPGCMACDPAAAGSLCASGAKPPRIDVAPAAGFPELAGPQVCACDKVCAAHTAHQLPADCDCDRRCHCQ